jgi:hypothetical protein
MNALPNAGMKPMGIQTSKCLLCGRGMKFARHELNRDVVVGRRRGGQSVVSRLRPRRLAASHHENCRRSTRGGRVTQVVHTGWGLTQFPWYPMKQSQSLPQSRERSRREHPSVSELGSCHGPLCGAVLPGGTRPCPLPPPSPDFHPPPPPSSSRPPLPPHLSAHCHRRTNCRAFAKHIPQHPRVQCMYCGRHHLHEPFEPGLPPAATSELVPPAATTPPFRPPPPQN